MIQSEDSVAPFSADVSHVTHPTMPSGVSATAQFCAIQEETRGGLARSLGGRKPELHLVGLLKTRTESDLR